MKRITLLLTCMFPLFIFAQDQAAIYTFIDQHFNNKPISHKDISNINGSPFMFENFKKGSVYQANKLIAKDIDLRYNIYNNEIEIKLEKEEIYNISKDINLSLITIDKNQFIFKKLSDKQKKKQVLQLLHKGKRSLFKHHKITYQKEILPEAYSDAIPACFKKAKPSYYITTANSDLIEVRSLKDLSKKFPKLNKEIKKEYKQNRLKFNDTDLIKLVIFIESKF
ncbi:hypothetical protein EMN47_19435 [Prolixibacteraceae bacterium JC049]|nr:hypothetical protein [Prolixibacteraceae bacterium JC049]